MGRLTVSLNDVQPRDLSLKRPCHIGVGPAFKFLTRQVLDGSHQLSLLESTITDHNSRVKHLGVFLKKDVQFCSLADINLYSLITEKLVYKDSVGVSLEGVRSVRISRCTHRCALNHYNRPRNRLIGSGLFDKT